jgi:hypothetical protein
VPCYPEGKHDENRSNSFGEHGLRSQRELARCERQDVSAGGRFWASDVDARAAGPQARRTKGGAVESLPRAPGRRIGVRRRVCAVGGRAGAGWSGRDGGQPRRTGAIPGPVALDGLTWAGVCAPWRDEVPSVACALGR